MRMWVFLIPILFPAVLFAAEERLQPSDSLSDFYTWKAFETLIWDEGDPHDPNNAVRAFRQFQDAYEDRLLPKDLHYLAATGYSFHVSVIGDNARLKTLCDLDPPHGDDYPYRARCLAAYEMPIGRRVDQLYEIAEAAYKAHPTQLTGSTIMNNLAEYLTQMSRNNEGIRAFKRSIEMIPPGAAEELIESRLSLAYAYVNPMLNAELKKQAITYYQEAIAYYQQQTGSYYRSQEIVISYNMGIAQLFLFDDYANAIRNFQKGIDHSFLGIDARVFLAFTYAKSGQTHAARETLKTIDLTQRLDPQRVDFLYCYYELSQYLLGDNVRLTHCLAMESPQADVLLHLTNTFYDLKLPAADENIWWRKFYQTFRTNMLTDIQTNITSAGAEAELVRERAEGRLKDLKLQNLALYQYLVATLAALALLLGIAGFVTWKARARARDEHLRLQNILDSIEEGIFLIDREQVMIAEESAHLQKILGVHYRPRMTLTEFLDLTTLAKDLVATQIACVKAAMDEDRLAWDLNQANLVTEVRLGPAWLALFWQPVFQQNRLQSIFLALRDITDVQELRERNQKAQEDADKVLIYAREILQGNSAATLRFLNELPALFERLHAAIKEQQFSPGLRIAHTIKGTARTLGLNDLRNTMHELETCLHRRDRANIHDTFRAAQAMARLYRSAQQFVSDGQRNDAIDLFHIISELRGGVETHMREAGLVLGGIHVLETGRLTPFEYEQVREILLHGLTNATDHGFIIPTRRGQTTAMAQLTVEIHADQQQRSLTIRDNGAGLAHAQLQALAAARGWRPQLGETWTDFLFTDGITTAETVTMSSGRGVGLSAVKQAAQSMGGQVRLRDNDQSAGTLLEVTWQMPAKAA